MHAYLYIGDNRIKGEIFGYNSNVLIKGELVFQTGMVGYIESLTDPSYQDQILVLTYPMIGNYGVPNLYTNSIDSLPDSISNSIDSLPDSISNSIDSLPDSISNSIDSLPDSINSINSLPDSINSINSLPDSINSISTSTSNSIYNTLLNFESDRIHVKALIVSEHECLPSHWSSTINLDSWLKQNRVLGVSGVDTRQITKMITESGTSICKIVPVKEVQTLNETGSPKVLVVDCGVKYSMIRLLINKYNCCLKIVPWYLFQDMYNINDTEYNHIFISNGPGDPKEYLELVNSLKSCLTTEQFRNKTVFGICLGHQILSLAAGGDTYKMKFGNRGHNVPCKLINSDRCFITSQNHGYAVTVTEVMSESWNELFVNLNDKSNEGVVHKVNNWFTVQFHPEAKAGPEDSSFLFDVFVNSELKQLRLRHRHRQQVKRVVHNKKSYNKLLILGSGGLTVGQSGEFDYSGSQAIKAFKEEGLYTVLINPNIATVQTSENFADKVYFLPITSEYVVKVIEDEKPDCISITFGGQTALNCGIQLYKTGVLSKYNVEILGTDVENIIKTEDRDLFKNLLLNINETVPEGFTSENFDDAFKKAVSLGYPVLVRSAYSLGGLGSGFANNDQELHSVLRNALCINTNTNTNTNTNNKNKNNNNNQVIIDKSLKGWKEIEYEVVRDCYDNCITVCNMENLDPLGVHTGESIVVAPSQTLTDTEYNMLRTVSLKIVRELKIVGECNVQFALNPTCLKYHIIEVNARLSRSSALASKATGYPLAYIAAKLCLGYNLIELKNSVTSNLTTACFEPSLDYIVVKVPRWDLDKFPLADRKLNSAMKSVGESMAVSRSFEEAFQKAIRMSNESVDGFVPNVVKYDEDLIKNCEYNRMLSIADGLYNGISIKHIHDLTKIDMWFLQKMLNIVNMIKNLYACNINGRLDKDLLLEAKQLGFNDRFIAKTVKSTETDVYNLRYSYGLRPVVKQIDTVSGEFPCTTNYLYLTYNGSTDDIINNVNNVNNQILVIGSGVYRIGSSVEFDWCSVNCVRELKKLGYSTIVLNCNPETVSTDYDEVDTLYFDEISSETVLDIYRIHNNSLYGVVLAMGGQLSNNMAISLHSMNVPILGTSATQIDNAENRYKFSKLLDSIAVSQAEWKELTSVQEAKQFCQKVGYPCLIRPSYVLSGAAMNVAHCNKDLKLYLENAVSVSREHPVVISKFISDAKEIEVDAVADNGVLKLIAVSEHVENAGVHSGDATLILPTVDVNNTTLKKIRKATVSVAKALQINGPFNVQFIAKDDNVLVIECNLRVSRSFPFVSKTLNVNFVEFATKCMLGLKPVVPHIDCTKYGVKVAQFSFNRLTGADVKLGVEMMSTGEVACFGKTHYEAFIKGLIASGFNIPRKIVVVSIGSDLYKAELTESVENMLKLGLRVICTIGTAEYYRRLGLNVESVLIEDCIKIVTRVDALFNVSQTDHICSKGDTAGYILRRCAVNNNVPVLTDVKKIKMLIQSMLNVDLDNVQINKNIDCLKNCLHNQEIKPVKPNIVRIPGLIDVHVHIREPGNPYKGDWSSETKAAIAGGFTTICVMPNVDPPIVDQQSFNTVDDTAKVKAHCDYALFVGATTENKETAHELYETVAGIKMYLNNTYGPLLLDSMSDWSTHIKMWFNNNNHSYYQRPICVHAESKSLGAVLHIAHTLNKKIHVCHVSTKDEIELIKHSKSLGVQVTCEVAPHHLFSDRQCFTTVKERGLTDVKPPLNTVEDCKALWLNLDIIDCFATDHAPHTVEDKKCKFCPGFPGLETALPLLLTAVSEGLLTLDDVVLRCCYNPRRIFQLPEQENTFVEVDLNKEWVIPDKMLYSKCAWTPFTGVKVKGKIVRVVLRGETVYENDQVINKEGSGMNVRLIKDKNKDKDNTSDININSNINIKNIITVEQFDRNFCEKLFNLTDSLKIGFNPNLLKGKIMASIFYEPSTRTRCSFTAAMLKLGGQVVTVTADESSVAKGESVEDFVRCMESYTDVTVIRYNHNGLNNVLKVVKNPIINCGDGFGEHPTQALLDVYTIKERFGKVDGLDVLMIGDLKYGRTVHSLAKLLCLYKDVTIRFVSPVGLEIPEEVVNYLDKYKKINNIKWCIHETLDDAVTVIDVLYITRVQKERFNGFDIYFDTDLKCVVTPESVSTAKSTMIIMHPMPRVNELSTQLDDDPRAVYFKQMENGLYVRMALLSLIFNT